MQLPVLNFTPFVPRLRQIREDTFIFDIIRKKFVALTPEEWVRQHLIHELILKNYSPSLIAVESGLIINKVQRRTDVLTFTNTGTPFLLVECKAYNIELNEEVLNQTFQYNYQIKAPFFALTNGYTHYVGKVLDKGKWEVINEFPF
jgi:hypothetical protein